jgi:hypothetical protein
MTAKAELVKLIAAHLFHDRAVLAGASSSGVSLGGSYGITYTAGLLASSLATVQQWVALFAGVFGGLAALATLIYVSYKIIRMWRNPRSLE